MAPVHVSIAAAFGEAWERMKTILFRPFDPAKWLVLAFTAWLAGLTGGNTGVGWNVNRWPGGGDSPDLEWDGPGTGSVLRDIWEGATRWFADNPLWLFAAVLGCAGLILFFLALLWISSRGKFMFLDNVIHDRALVVAPWKRFRRLGNSHFLFQVMLTIVLLVFFLGLAATILGLAPWSWANASNLGWWWIFLAVAIPLLFLVLLTIAYIQFFLDGFVVPLMHRHDLGVMAAWSRFGELFRRHPWPLLLSGLFLFILAIAAGLAIMAAGLMTCCVGFLFLMIPYVGTVLILPVPVIYRAFTLALLDQIDPGYFPSEQTEP